MSVLVFEFVSGGGLYQCPGAPQPTGSLLVEGAAMVQALVEDLARSTAAPVTRLFDVRLAPALTPRHQENVSLVPVDSGRDLETALRQNAQVCDVTIVIAPESAGILLSTRDLVARAGGHWLGCSAQMLRWASDKTATIRRLAEHRVPGPSGVQSLGAPDQMPALPVVVKPNNGAGSEDIAWVRTAAEWEAIEWQDGAYRIERYCAGQPASLAVICGPRERRMLAPCLQTIDVEGRFAYRGGRVLAPGPLADRVLALGTAVLPALDGALGYVGIDLVLGAAADGRDDVVLEVNPRLTTSYLGLRAACCGNLAQAILDSAVGQIPRIEFSCVPLDFRENGTNLHSTRSSRESTPSYSVS
jgi:predicted ATP-grasp superfamily ATP-dependent carboligase